MSIFKGTSDLVDKWLEVSAIGKPPYYRHRSALNELSKRKRSPQQADEFLASCYRIIHQNWQAAVVAGNSRISNENWRWKRHLELGEANVSPELQLERRIVEHGGDAWSNQMPVASGLTGPASNKRSAVDLIFQESETRYSFIELKVNSDTPLFAAVEILLYGLVFAWSKDHWQQLGYDEHLQPVLQAQHVDLCVLAPASYYERSELTGLTAAINQGLQTFSAQRSLDMSFAFRELSSFEPTSGISY